MARRILLIFVTVCALAAGCSRSEPAPPTTTVPPTTSAPTTVPPTTAPPPTTVPPPAADITIVEAPPQLTRRVEELYEWLVDEDRRAPSLPAGLETHLAARALGQRLSRTGMASSATLPNGDTIAVVSLDEDVMLALDDGTGWRIAGASLPTLGFEPWYGPSPRLVLIIGSDARPGENQQLLRADSIHIVGSVPAAGAGSIVGFPRDSWVSSEAGNMKFTNVMANRGPEFLLNTTRNLTDLPLEGYLVTGFDGFLGFFAEFGDLTITLENAIRSGITGWSNYPAGEQQLTPTEVLRLARIRKTLPRGDFDRSENHGVIMKAALVMAQAQGVAALPQFLEMLLRHAWTDLETEDLLTFGAGLFALDTEAIVNVVVPGSLGTVGAASVVFLGDGAEQTYRDLEDGLLGN